MNKQVEYIDTGVNWIGEIPNTWKSKRIKMLTRVKRGASPRPIDNPIYFDEEGEFAWVRIADVTASERYLENTTQRLSELGSASSVKRYPDDFFLSIAGSVGKPIITKIKCCIHDGFVYFPDLKINPEFLYYVFSTGLPYLGLGKLGTQLNLNTDTVGDIYIPIPGEKEIEKIVSFLDLKTSEIDKIISDKQKLIDCLNEEKIAIINQAITEGLNPKVGLENSKLYWIGNTPKHWQIKKLKYLVSKVGSGVTPSGGASVYLNEGIPLLRSQNIYNDGLHLDDVSYISELIDEQMKNSRVFEGDVLLNVTGASIGRCYFIPKDFGKGNVNQHVCIIRPVVSLIDTKFLYFILISKVGQLQIDYNQTGANREGLNFEQIKNFTVPLPPLNEQKEIVKFMELNTEHLDKTINKIEQEIELIKEYRTSLINEVVTGKMLLN